MRDTLLRVPVRRWLRHERGWPLPHEQFVREWRDGWQEAMRRASAEDRVDDLHAARGTYQAAFKATLQILDGLLVLADGCDADGPPADRVRRVRDDLQRLHDEVFGDWHTVADLERKMVAAFSRPNAELLAVAEASPPPDWWWTDDDDDLRAPACGAP